MSNFDFINEDRRIDAWHACLKNTTVEEGILNRGMSRVRNAAHNTGANIKGAGTRVRGAMASLAGNDQKVDAIRQERENLANSKTSANHTAFNRMLEVSTKKITEGLLDASKMSSDAVEKQVYATMAKDAGMMQNIEDATFDVLADVYNQLISTATATPQKTLSNPPPLTDKNTLPPQGDTRI